MAIAIQMPGFEGRRTYTPSRYSTTQPGRRDVVPPKLRILIEHLDQLIENPNQMDDDCAAKRYSELWSAYAKAAYIPRLDKVATLRALDRLKTLATDWSGYSAIPIDRRLILSAKEFILGLPTDIIGTPTVVPMTRGRLQLEWHQGNRSLELEFESAGRIHYLKWDSDAGIEEEDTIPGNDVAMIYALLQWFAAEPGNA